MAWKQGKGSGKGRKKAGSWAWPAVVLTSRCPLCTAWCRALRPLLSATLRLLSRGARASAHLVARLAAATCNGVCHSLSRAFTSAECASSSPSTFCGGVEDKREDRGGAGGRNFTSRGLDGGEKGGCELARPQVWSWGVKLLRTTWAEQCWPSLEGSRTSCSGERAKHLSTVRLG